MKNIIKIQLSMLMAAIVMLTGCGEDDVEQAPKAEPPKLVKAITLTHGSNGEYREFPGVVEASKDAILAFRVPGQLFKLEVTSGQMVEEGELLAQLDQTDYQIAVDRAQANYDLAKIQFERTEKLLEKNLTSQSGFDGAKAQMQVAKAVLKAAEANFSYTELRAPFSGQVAQRFVENFESISPQRPVFLLQKTSDVSVAIQVPEDLLSNAERSSEYQPEVRFDTHPDQVFRAKLKEYDSEANPATNTYKIVLSLPRPESFTVLPGMSATVIAELDQFMKSTAKGWSIPASAIFSGTESGEQKSYVWVIKLDQHLEKREVQVDGITEEGFRVLEGLSYGEQIVTAGVHRLSEDEPVRVWQKERGL